MENIHKLPILLLLLVCNIVLPSSIVWLFANYMVLPNLGINNISFLTALSVRMLVKAVYKEYKEDKDFESEKNYKEQLHYLIKSTLIQYFIFIVILVLNKYF